MQQGSLLPVILYKGLGFCFLRNSGFILRLPRSLKSLAHRGDWGAKKLPVWRWGPPTGKGYFNNYAVGTAEFTSALVMSRFYQTNQPVPITEVLT